jgi:hypothetical protein
MAAIMRPAGAPGGLRLDAMTPAAALRSAAGGCLMGFKSLFAARHRTGGRRPRAAVPAARGAHAATPRRGSVPRPTGNRGRDGRQPAHRGDAGVLAMRPGSRHPRVCRAEQHRAHLPAGGWPGPAQPRLARAPRPPRPDPPVRPMERRAPHATLRPRLPAHTRWNS